MDSRAGSHVSPSAVYAAGRLADERRVFGEGVRGARESTLGRRGGQSAFQRAGRPRNLLIIFFSHIYVCVYMCVCVCILVVVHKYLQQQQQQQRQRQQQLYNVYTRARALYALRA
jgi:hypothetical protein